MSGRTLLNAGLALGLALGLTVAACESGDGGGGASPEPEPQAGASDSDGPVTDAAPVDTGSPTAEVAEPEPSETPEPSTPAGLDPDGDEDLDGFPNGVEEAHGTDPEDAQSQPPDLDGDKIPDADDLDRDGDGTDNDDDAFPEDATESLDTDGDGTGDGVDLDDDGDQYPDAVETQQGTDPKDPASVPEDLDGDGDPDATDDDIDGDDAKNIDDAFPYDPTEQLDTDGDGLGDNGDLDDDGDGYPDTVEAAAGTDPLDGSDVPLDVDGDGIPDTSDQDIDGDGVQNDDDAFPTDAAETVDTDGDGIGNVADLDDDGDGYPDEVEGNVGSDPLDATDKPADLDQDGIPDADDDDIDGDGVLNPFDAFPTDGQESHDFDGDGVGDKSDEDDDGDGWDDAVEDQVGTDPYDKGSVPDDLDQDGEPDALDPDLDGDGVDNPADAFPFDPAESADNDQDGQGDVADPDDDNDGFVDLLEAQYGSSPTDAASTPPDLDGDKVPDDQDPDLDGDGVDNGADAFPSDPAEQIDSDGDGTGDNADGDDDDDLFADIVEAKYGSDPKDPTSQPPDLDGDKLPDLDDPDLDGDGVENLDDAFPTDPLEQKDTDLDGTGDKADVDDDNDGYADAVELSYASDPLDADSTPPDLDGDKIPDGDDPDLDGDNWANGDDVFPSDPSEWADFDGDGQGDNSDEDDDGDQYPDIVELEHGSSPLDNTSTPPDLDGDLVPDAVDDDRDGDEVDNGADPFPDDPSEWLDTDSDGVGNNEDEDDDQDGYDDIVEGKYLSDPLSADSTPPDVDGDLLADLDDPDIDGDGYPNQEDAFPFDPLKWEEYVPADSFGGDYQQAIPLDADPDAFEAQSFTLVRGTILDLEGAPVSGAKIVVLDHPEYGSAITDPDGEYVIAVNGGGYTTLCVDKEGYPRLDRTVRTPWNDIVVAPTVQLSPLDLEATSATVGGEEGEFIVHQNTGLKAPVTVVVPAEAEVWGITEAGSKEPLESFTLRATEYETEDAMPATLPPSSDFTYCVELTLDGYDQAEFSVPVTVWLPNFTGFLVGDVVPVGYYDRELATWIPSPNGRVVELLDLDGDTIVDAVDGTGDGLPDDLTGDGTTTDEVAGVQDAKGFEAGVIYWRFETDHFSPHDPNYPSGPPPDAEPPPSDPGGPKGPDGDKPGDPDDCGSGGSSRVGQRRGTLHQDIPVTGTDLQLHYSSEFVPGYAQEVRFFVSGPEVPESLESIEVSYGIAGNQWEAVLPGAPNQSVSFIWSGEDWQGTPSFGKHKAWVTTAFVYPGFFYASPSAAQEVSASFAAPGTEVTGTNTLGPIKITRTLERDVFRFDQWGGVVKTRLGPGWSIGGYFTFDGESGAILGAGGDRVYAQDVGLRVGTDNAEPLEVIPQDVVVDDMGVTYFSAASTSLLSHVIFRLDEDGEVVVHHEAEAPIDDLAIDPRGGLVYASDHTVWRLVAAGATPIAIANLLFEFFDCFVYLGSYCSLEVAVDPDGFVRATTNQIGPSGAKNVVLVAPTGQIVRFPVSFYCEVGDLALDPAGGTLVSCANGPIRRVNPDGNVEELAGWSQHCETPGAYTGGHGMAVTPDGSIFLADRKCHRISKWDSTYGSNAYLGDGLADYSGDGGPLLGARLDNPRGVALSPDGSLVVADSGNSAIRSVRKQEAGLPTAEGEILIPIGDNLGLVFSDTKVLKGTRDLVTGADKIIWVYDEGLRLEARLDHVGNAITFVHDDDDRVVQVVGSTGITTDLDYDAGGRLASIVRPDDSSYDFTYDFGARMTKKTTPDGGSASYTFDEAGRVASTTNAADQERTFETTLTATTRTLRRTEPDGTKLEIHEERTPTGAVSTTVGRVGGPKLTSTRSADGLLTTMTGSDGSFAAIEEGFDPRDGSPYTARATLKTPGGLEQLIEHTRDYDADGTYTESVWRNGQLLTTYVYDPLGRTFTKLHADGTETVATLDADVDRLVSIEAPGLAPITFEYDELGRVTSTTQGSNVESWVFGEEGSLDEMIHPDQSSTLLERDSLGRVSTVTWPDGTTTSYAYTAGNEYAPEGKPETITLPSGEDLSFVWDEMVRITEAHKADGGLFELSYGPTGLVDEVVLPDGTIKAYDWLGRKLQKLTYVGVEDLESATVAYGADGRPELLTSPEGVQDKITWDGDLVTGITRVGPPKQTFGATYDDHFRVVSHDVLGATWVHEWDELGRLAAVDGITIVYDAETGDSVGSTDGAASWVIERDVYGNDAGRQLLGDEGVSFGYSLERDEAWQVIGVTEQDASGPTRDLDFGIDLLGRLEEVHEGGVLVEAYSYDANGNRLSASHDAMGWSGETWTYGPGDVLVESPDGAYTYDLLGHRVGATTAEGETTYTHTPDGVLRSVALPDGTLVEYTHDFWGRLATRAVDGQITERYVFGGSGELVAVTDAAGAVQERYLWLHAMPVRVELDGTSYRIGADQLGSLRALVDPSGEVVASRTWDSYGNLLEATGSLEPSLGYALGIHDPLTGLTHLGPRAYEPRTGVFLSPDPTGWTQGLNLYAYVDGMPHWVVDPWGLWGIEVGGKFGLFGAEVGGKVGIGWNDNGLQLWGGGKAGAGASVGVGLKGGSGKLGGKVGVGAGKVELGANWNASPPMDGSSTFQGDVGAEGHASGSLGLKGVVDAHAGYSYKESYLTGKSSHGPDVGATYLNQQVGMKPDGNGGYTWKAESKNPMDAFDIVDKFNDGDSKTLLGLEGEAFYGSYAEGQINLSNIAKSAWDGAKNAWNGLKNWWDCL